MANLSLNFTHNNVNYLNWQHLTDEGTSNKPEAVSASKWSAEVTKAKNAEVHSLVGSLISKKLNTLADAWGYSSYQSAMGYRNCGVDKYHNEAVAIARYAADCFSHAEGLASQIGTIRIDHIAEDVQSIVIDTLPEQPQRPSA